jgi:hypothetical protein
MRTYRMTYRDTMALPMKVFWHLSGSVDRLLADEHKDFLELTTLAQNPEAANERLEHLQKAAPSPIKLTARAVIEATSARDEAGFQELRLMS